MTMNPSWKDRLTRRKILVGGAIGLTLGIVYQYGLKIYYQSRAYTCEPAWNQSLCDWRTAHLGVLPVRDPSGYELDISPKPPSGQMIQSFNSQKLVAIENGSRIIFNSESLAYCSAGAIPPYQIRDNVLYFADFIDGSGGAVYVVAYDLRAGKVLWCQGLIGIGRRWDGSDYDEFHIREFFGLLLDVDAWAVRVQERREKGEFVEYCHRRTGDRLGHWGWN